MSNQYLSFDVTKQSTPQQLITGRQGDSQLKFVSVLLWDGEKNIPYDLTGKQVAFEALKPDGTHIVDYEGINILDASHGLFRYSFNEQVFAVAGTMQQAFFKITHTDKDDQVIADSTLEINIHILENRVEFGINSTDYLSEYDDLIAKVKQKFDDYAATVQDSIDKAQQVHDEVTKLLAQIDDIKSIMNRRVAVQDSTTIKMQQSGDWTNSDTTTISSDIIISEKKDNGISIEDDGLYIQGKPEKFTVDFNKTPFYYGALASIQQTVAQSVLMSSNNDIYLIQAGVNDAPDNERHATINHLTPAGVFVDKMEILHSGHGAGWQIIKDSAEQITFLFIGEKAGIHKPVLLAYEAGQRVDVFNDSSLEELPNSNNEDGELMLDVINNQVGLVTNNEEERDVVKIYYYQEFMKQGLNAPVIQTFNPEITTLQGAVLSDGVIYIYNSTIFEDDQKIISIDVNTHEEKIIKLGNLGHDPRLETPSSLEGEALLTWTNPKTSETSFMIAVATGYAGGTKRVVKLYMWNGPDNQPIFNRLFNEKIQTLKTHDGDGSAFTFDEQPEKLSDIMMTGHYYFNSENFNKFSDKPNNYALGNSGFFLNVYPDNKSDISIQELIRLNSSNYNMKFFRTINARLGTQSQWIYSDAYSDHAIKPINTIASLSELHDKGTYYLNTSEWASLLDVPEDPNIGYGTSGFFVFISQKNNDDFVTQEAVRNTTTNNTVKLVRTVLATDGTASNWIITQSEDSNVHKTGNETVAGNKTFTGNTTMIIGKYGFRITSSGFEKTIDGGEHWSEATL